jgi:GTP 3',8-cyclase
MNGDECRGMIDSFNRDITYMRISVTDRCNLRCVYCMPKEGISRLGHDDILRYEEIRLVVAAAVNVGITKVRITGGEPLVRKGVVEFIADLRALRGIDDISLTTNGILLEQFARPLYEAGIRRINVSLDSLDPARYADITRGGDLQAVLRGIAAAHAVGFAPIKINTVAMKGGIEGELTAFARQTIDMPFQVRFIELMPLGGSDFTRPSQFLSNDDVRKIISRAYPLEPVNGKRGKSDGPARLFRIPGARGEVGFISPLSHHFCSSCNRLRLTADGHLRVCLLSDAEVDLKGPLRAGCSTRDLEGLIRHAIAAKPREHALTAEGYTLKKCVKEMSAIGG